MSTARLAALTLAVSAPAFAGATDALRQAAEQDDNRQLVQFIDSGNFDGSYVTLSSGTPSISALEVALKAAEENNDFQAAKHIRAQIDGAAFATTSVSSKGTSGISAFEVALKDAVEKNDFQKANHIKTRLAN